MWSKKRIKHDLVSKQHLSVYLSSIITYFGGVCYSFSHVQLFATPWGGAHQAHPSMGFSGQDYWSGLPLRYIAAAAAAKSLYSCLTLCDPMDCSPPGFSVHWIL